MRVIWRDVERRLSEQPKCDDAHDDPEKQPIVGMASWIEQNGLHAILQWRLRDLGYLDGDVTEKAPTLDHGFVFPGAVSVIPPRPDLLLTADHV